MDGLVHVLRLGTRLRVKVKVHVRAYTCMCVQAAVSVVVLTLMKQTFLNKAKGYRKENWVKKKESRAKVH